MSKTTAASPSDKRRELRLLGVLASVCGVAVAGGFSMFLFLGASSTPSVFVLGDVSEAHIVEIRNHHGEAVAFGEFRSRVDRLGNIEKDAGLIDHRGRIVIGEVELEIPAPDRRDRRVELEVDIIGLPARQTFAVVIDDRTVGTFTTDDRGSVDMELQEGEVPALPQEI
jgi:hypothetical protein